MKHAWWRARQGVVLFEVLVSIIILSVGLTGVIRSFLTGIQAHSRTQEYLTAAVLLENTLTELLAARYFDAARAGYYDGMFSFYRYEIFAENVSDRPFLKKVRVVVLWPGPQQERFLDAVVYLFSRPIEGRG